jgi:hypothetical protein
MVSPVHQQCVFGVDHRLQTAKTLHAAGVRFEVDHFGNQRGRKPPGGVSAQRTAPSDQSHQTSNVRRSCAMMHHLRRITTDAAAG